METDRTKFFSFIKIVAVLTYFAYFAVYNSNLNTYLPLHPKKEDLGIYQGSQKTNLPNNVSFALIGGSNTLRGLSGEIISSDSNICINYAIDNEYGDNDKYFNWIDGKVKADIVVYSSGIIWDNGNKIFGGYIQNSKLNCFQSPPIASQIISFFNPKTFSEPFEFNNFGDIKNFGCDQGFINYEIKPQLFDRSNDSISKEIFKRINKLKEITNANKIMFRVPPIYTSEKNQEFHIKMMRKRIEIIKNLGIIVVGENFVFTDKTLFCDNLHPNQKGRAFFSKELKNALMRYKVGN
jgi:hypothetical protein